MGNKVGSEEQQKAIRIGTQTPDTLTIIKVRFYLCLPVCLSVCVPVCQSYCLSACLSASYLPVCLHHSQKAKEESLPHNIQMVLMVAL